MMIRTNRYEIKLDINKIAEDFVFIRFERTDEKKWWGALELDLIMGGDFKARAVCYAKYAYAMFDRKSIKIYELLKKLRSNTEFSQLAAVEVIPEAVYSGNEGSICGPTLVKIILNSLGASRSKYANKHFSNLTGKLLQVPPLNGKFKDSIQIIEVQLLKTDCDGQYLLDIIFGTYRKKIGILKDCKQATGERRSELERVLKRPEYCYHAGRNCLVRWTSPGGKKSDNKTTYIKCKSSGKRQHVNFLDFSNSHSYDQSRAGVLNNVYKVIKNELSDHLQIQPALRKISDNLVLDEKLMKRPAQLKSKLTGSTFKIVDRVEDEDSKELTSRLKEVLNKFVENKKSVSAVKNDKKGALNFRIIHDASFYDKNEMKDEYLGSDDKYQRQNLTIESCLPAPETIVKTLVKELLIKRDLATGSFELFDWTKLNTDKTWTFAVNDNSCERFVFMDIQPSGDFKFREVLKGDLFGHGEHQKYIGHIEQSLKNEWRGLFFEGLVASSDGEINLILRTNEISLPDLDEVERMIKEVDEPLPVGKQTGYELATVVESYCKSLNIENKPVKELQNALTKIANNELKKQEFRQLTNEYLGKGSKHNADFRGYLLNKYDIRLNFSKRKENLDSLFPANMNINYFAHSRTEAFYCVGERRENIQSTFKDACHLRKIVAIDDSELIFNEILPTMNVDFVRTGQSTVLPFPFKYLREYIKK